MTERHLAAVATRDPPLGMPDGELRRADIDPAADGTVLATWFEAFEDAVGIEAAMRKPGAEGLQNFQNDLWGWCAPHADGEAHRSGLHASRVPTTWIRWGCGTCSDIILSGGWNAAIHGDKDRCSKPHLEPRVRVHRFWACCRWTEL